MNDIPVGPYVRGGRSTAVRGRVQHERPQAAGRSQPRRGAAASSSRDATANSSTGMQGSVWGPLPASSVPPNSSSIPPNANWCIGHSPRQRVARPSCAGRVACATSSLWWRRLAAKRYPLAGVWLQRATQQRARGIPLHTPIGKGFQNVQHKLVHRGRQDQLPPRHGVL